MQQFRAAVGELNPTQHGMVVSSILLAASISSFFAGPLAERISRTYAIAIGAFHGTICATTPTGSRSV